MGQCTSGELPPAQNHVDKKLDQTETGTPLINGGATNALSTPKFKGRRRNLPASWVSTRLSRRQKSNNLSDTFNLLDHSCKNNLVNVNIAPEEELMTLPGISRQLAHNIVEYRSTIGGFRRIEDLALVSGVGASKLQNIKNDVTLKKFPSYSSSRTQSIDSLPSCDSVKSAQSTSGPSIRSSSSRLVNVNTSSIFELMVVRGMTQEMAANIVHYRTKRGNFKNIDQLVKVRGINNRILYMISSHLTCGDTSPSSPVMHDTVSVGSCGRTLYASPKIKVQGHRRTQSEPLQAEDTVLSIPCPEPEPQPNKNHRFSSEFSADLFELLSLRSDRPFLDNVFTGVYNNSPAIRVGSWNMQHLSREKINNLGVLEVICRTILENGFSILALQEVQNKEVLEKICCELNQGSLRRIREWSGPRGDWHWLIDDESSCRKTAVSEYSAYIYNASHGISVLSSNLLQVHNNNNSKSMSALLRKPYLAYFQIRDSMMVLVNLHIKRRKSNRATIEEVAETEDGQDDLEDVLEDPSIKKTEPKNNFEVSCLSTYVLALKDKLIPEKHDLILGSFALPPDDKVFDILHENSHINIIPPDAATDISAENPKGSSCLDNIWLSSQTNKLYTGSWGIIRDGLSHMAIPRGWGWGGYVSDHCPIYCDLFTQVNNNTNSKPPLAVHSKKPL